MKSIVMNVLWIICGIGLLAYPFILLANVMSFAGHRRKNAGNNKFKIKRLAFRLILILTTLFPLIYYYCYRYSKDFLESGQLFYACLVMVPALAISARILWIFRPKTRRSPE